MNSKIIFSQLSVLVLLAQVLLAQQPKVYVQNGSFVDENGDCFVPFGYNYVGSKYVSLLEDNWYADSAWATITGDFQEMRQYSANTARIHLQYNKFMDGPNTPNEAAFDRLTELVQLAEANRLYLLVTGLGAYRKTDQPAWYDALDEQQRWATQAVFWAKVAETIGSSSAVFSYDLMNEPVSTDTTTWLPGTPFGSFNFVQNLTRTPNGRTFGQIVTAWVQQMKNAIRAHDPVTPITVGFIACGTIKAWSADLDYISTHIYPRPDTATNLGLCALNLSNAINYVNNNLDDKPFVLSEIGPLYSFEATDSFMRATCPVVNGWISHYGGTTLEELSDTSLLDAIRALSLRGFKARYPELHRCQSACGGDVALLEGCEPDPDLVACYSFNGNWNDGSSWAQHLDNYHTVLGTDKNGQPNAAAVLENSLFNLPLKFLTAPDHPLTQPRHDQSITLVARLYPRKGSPISVVWAYDDGDEHDGDSPAVRDFLRLETVNAAFFNPQFGNHAALQFRLVYGSSQSVSLEKTEDVWSDCLLYDRWYTVCAVYDVGKDSSFLYVDGHLQQAVAHNLPAPWAAIGQYPMIGRTSFNAPSNPFHTGAYFGSIDYLKIFKRALHPTEIAAYTVPLADTACVITVSTTAAQQPATIRPYPNPTADQVMLQAAVLDGTFRVRLMDISGQTLWLRDMAAALGLLRVPLGDLPAGLYLMQLTAENGQTYLAQFFVSR